MKNLKSERKNKFKKTNLRHLSLFSGIGGFDLAAQWAGWNNICQIEIDKYCQKILQKNFINVKKYLNIKDFNETEAKKYKGAIDVISGGFPCQPFSISGKRKGSADNRYLWKEMFKTIQIIKPKWVVIENVQGILNIENGMVFEKCCSDLETEGFEVEAYLIPAVAVDCCHLRERVWIVAHSVVSRRRWSGNSSKIFEKKEKKNISKASNKVLSSNDK